MKIKSVEIIDLLFRRPGITKILYKVDYGSVKRRGEIVYDTLTKRFLTNVSEIELLALVCSQLSATNNITFADTE